MIDRLEDRERSQVDGTPSDWQGQIKKWKRIEVWWGYEDIGDTRRGYSLLQCTVITDRFKTL